MNYYPTKEHEIAARKIVEIFSKDSRVMSVLLIDSCARKNASKDSDLDVCVIVKNTKMIEPMENEFVKKYEKLKEFVDIKKAGRYAEVDVKFTDGQFKISERSWTSGPDDYELEIGNKIAYAVVLFDRNGYFEKLKKDYLPYYSENLRKRRLKEVKMHMYNNLNHILLYVKRGLYFQSFSRLYNASKEFLQALFIKNKTYPISYDKWVKYQLVEVLHRPEIYWEFVKLYEIRRLESDELIKKSEMLRMLAKKYL